MVPDEIDIGFLKNFREMIIEEISNGKRFILITGGGKTARDYQTAAKGVVDLNENDLDWIGIHSTRLNAHLMKTIFCDIAHEEVIKNPTFKIEFKEKLLVAGGWKPGFSTDFDAVMLAENFGAKTVINLTNVDRVYDKDPSEHSDAKPIDEMSWKEFREIVGDEWSPGGNYPFDPVASKKSEELGLKVLIMNGKNLPNLKNYLDGKEFVGTVIK